MACLYLGGKVEDSPKSVRDVLMASCQYRFKDTARRLQHDRVSFSCPRCLLHSKQFSMESLMQFAWPAGILAFGVSVVAQHRHKEAARRLQHDRVRCCSRLIASLFFECTSTASNVQSRPLLHQCTSPPHLTYNAWPPAPQALYESLREKVFVAERALLYALDFQFATDLPLKVGVVQGSVHCVYGNVCSAPLDCQSAACLPP